jgi:tetratricopeptide (TPR) repeat protein
MSLRLPFRLFRRDDPAPAAAILLASDDPAALLAACARLADPLVFPVAGGFLVVAESAPPGVPGAVRLRRLSENCFLPVDADLVPALLPAEAVELTARRGLVFLPNRAPLAFDATRPLRPAAFLAVPRPRRDDWEPFPEGNPPADRLTAITRVLPEINPDDLLADTGPPVGTDDARPPQVGPGRAALGRASAGLGKGLGAIGKLFGSKKLGELGSKLTGLGAALAPRLTESLLGKQEAALQHLLKKFREGKTDEALRHSVPIGNEPGRGSQIHNSAQLPTHSLFWSLAGLFGGGGRSASIWAGGNPDTWRDLIAEYRRAAQQAADRGDFRRAALIYAKLLSDFRAAGEMLARGGLHRQAALLFRDKVRDHARAAQEFEKAGEHDEALRLYRDAHRNIEAGDLLRRLGEEEQAIEEYHRAADRVVQLRHDHVEAGDILLKKTGRADLAVPYFVRGWEARQASPPAGRNALPCAERLIEIYALAESRDPFWTLLAEAEDWLRQPGRSHEAARFFRRVNECADLPHLRADRGEIRDRCRLGLAGKLREHAKCESNPGTAVADLFGASKQWSPAVVSDADFALRAAVKVRRPTERPAAGRIQFRSLHAGTVTAAAQAPNYGDLFVGFQDGSVVHYSPEYGEVADLPKETATPVAAFATDANGERLVVLRSGLAAPAVGEEYSPLELLVWEAERKYQVRARTYVPVADTHGLLPLLDETTRTPAVGVSATTGVVWYDLPALTPRADTGPTGPLPPTMHLKLNVPGEGVDTTLTFRGGSVSWFGQRQYVGWMPDSAPGSTLSNPPLSWLVVSPRQVELAGLFDNATLYWTEVTREPRELRTRTLAFVARFGFRAVCVWRAGQVVGVTATNRVVWLKSRSGRFAEWASPVEITTPARAVACFPSRQTTEILIVLEDGSLARIPVPG